VPSPPLYERDPSVFIHRSNKTRIETVFQIWEGVGLDEFLYIDPIKQGLKRTNKTVQAQIENSFYT